MFSEACVSHSVHRRSAFGGGGLPPGEVCPTPPGTDIVAATAAVGTHPTGMHSCFDFTDKMCKWQ